MDPSNYTYQEPEEKNFTVLPKGEYEWAIIEINAMTQSKNGNPMIPIKFEFRDLDGNTAQVYENLVFSDAAAWKINQFLKSASGGSIEPGRKINFDSADTIKWLRSRTGRAKLGIEKAQGKNGEYERNKIEAFVYPDAKGGSAPPPKSVMPEAKVDDDLEIPF